MSFQGSPSLIHCMYGVFLQCESFGVNTQCKHWVGTECFSTFITFIKLFPSMNSLVLGKVCTSSECLPTITTLTGFHSHVKSLMLCKRWDISEGLPPIDAFIGFLPTVTSLMLNKGWVVTEGFPIFITYIRFLLSVNSLMLNRWIYSECFPTNLQAFSPVWVLWYSVKHEFWINVFPQSSHLWGFSPIWILDKKKVWMVTEIFFQSHYNYAFFLEVLWLNWT